MEFLENRIDDAENSGSGADPQGQREDGGQRETGRLNQLTKAVAQDPE